MYRFSLMYDSFARHAARAAAALLVAAALAPPAAAQVMDRILVIVNDEIITESEFATAMQRTLRELRAEGRDAPPRRVLENQVMENLILERIQLQIAESLNITVTESRIDRAIDEIAARQSLSREELMHRVRRTELTVDEYRAEIGKQIRIQRLVDRQIRRNVVVTDAEIDAHLATVGDEDAARKVEYEIAHIFLGASDDDPERAAELRRRAASIRAELEGGADFATLARRHSTGSDAAQGGYLGWRNRDRLPDLFYRAIRNLEAGAVSPVLESAGGLHIVKLIGRRGDERQTVEQWKVRHILFQARDADAVAEALAEARLLLARLREGEDFAKLARVHSDDELTRVKGGDFGWLGPGDTIPEFEEAVSDLDLEVFSEPVRTRFGVHIIQVLDRRKHDIGAERRRQRAELLLRERKVRDAYEQWAVKIREEAYVKFRIRPGT